MTTQLDAVRVLTGIIRRAAEAGLPNLTWNVSPYDDAPLTGQPWDSDDDPSARLATLAAWADHLGTTVVTERCRTFTNHEAAAEVNGIQVRIFTHTDNTHTYVSVPIGQAGGAR